jgi:lactate permease
LPWYQNYNPLHLTALSVSVSALPVLTLFFVMLVLKKRVWVAALSGILVAVILALVAFGMPMALVGFSAALGVIFGLLRIAWIIVASIFLYNVAIETGQFQVMKESIAALSADRRLQLILIAFCFGAFLEGTGGGGAPVAVAGSFLIGLGFHPFQAATLCLIANTAPVAWGGVGNPIRTLVGVTGLSELALSAMAGRILPLMSAILPLWLVRSMVGWKETREVWPALLVSGLSFAGMQFYWSNFQESGLVDIIAAIFSLLVMVAFLKVWKPRNVLENEGNQSSVISHQSSVSGQVAGEQVESQKVTGRQVTVQRPARSDGRAAVSGQRSVGDLVMHHSTAAVLKGWSPFILASVFIFISGLPATNKFLSFAALKQPMPLLHNAVFRVPPVVPAPAPEAAVMDLNILAMPGTAILFGAVLAGLLLGLSLAKIFRIFLGTLVELIPSLLAISFMVGLAFVTRYSGMDTVLGLSLTHTGPAFPFFGTLLGWLGVALTGTDAGSNALFGNLQKVTAEQLGLSPILMAAANSSGGVMGKMIDAQSIVVSSTATQQVGNEAAIFKAVFKHSIILACLVGLIVMMYAFVFPWLIPR